MFQFSILDTPRYEFMLSYPIKNCLKKWGFAGDISTVVGVQIYARTNLDRWANEKRAHGKEEMKMNALPNKIHLLNCRGQIHFQSLRKRKIQRMCQPHKVNSS